jgi:hypothetical protein
MALLQMRRSEESVSLNQDTREWILARSWVYQNNCVSW